MTRLLTTGFETGDVAEAGVSTIGSSASITVVNSTPVPRAGAYCLKVACASGSLFNISHKQFNFGAAKTEVWVRWAIYIHSGGSANEWGIAQLQDSTGVQQFSVTWDAVTNVLRLRLGSAASGTIQGTSVATLSPDNWHVLELRWQVLTATTGNAELWLDGTRVINFSGDVASTAVLNAQYLLLGQISTGSGATGGYQGIDDIAVNDTAGTLNNGRPGDGRVVLLVPSAVGSSTQLTRGGTDTGANYSQVNELPPSMGQYVYSATAGQRDLYAMSDIAAAVSSINVVEAVLLAQNSDAGGGSIGPTIKSGATVNEAAAIGLGTTAAYVRSQWETDPATSAAWTIAAVNALEAGATVR